MTTPTSEPVRQRLLSLDALRGFDMFWIVGGDTLVYALREAARNPFTNALALQMEHVAWAGLRFYDLIFPLFVFLAGVSLVYSLSRLIVEKGRGAALKRVLLRGLILYLLGILYYGGLSNTIGDIRLLGVLQRIALCYLAAGVLFIYLKPRALVIVCVGLLLSYWALMALVPVPGVGAGHYVEGRNLANYVDRMYLPLFKWDGDHDPEGLLSTIPAIGTCLLGVFAGLLLKDERYNNQRKVFWLVGAGVVLVAVGSLWGLSFPIIKKIWTSSYVLVAGGWSALLLALFYQVMDVWQRRKWAMPLVWIGSNAILLYLVNRFIDFGALASLFVGGPVKGILSSSWGEVLLAAGVVALTVLLAGFLYKRKIFIRI
jgi:predicted acyltransferase